MSFDSPIMTVDGNGVPSETNGTHYFVNGHQGTTNGHHASNGSTEGNGDVPIAICGMALRLPGGLTTPQQLWEFLLAKGDARSRVPASRYNISAYHSTTNKPGSVATEYGYFLGDDVDLGALDTSFFSMSRSELSRADPQQRLLLEVAREALEDAGVTNWRGRKIGCYVGSFGEDWQDLAAKETQPWGLHRVMGTGDFGLSNRVSYEMDLRGASMTIRTACSSAMVGLNEACMAIARGDCESAVVGGVNLIMSPTMTTAMTEQGVLSKEGSCKTFSADADGYARGEAITAVFIKPLADALRDGNPVRAVIKSSAHNVDGKTPGISTPSADAQEALIRRAYSKAGVTDLGATAMVEMHGTGTPTGDPIEADAVARVFGGSGIYIGSVKPNLGHAEGASGLVSVIKMVLALENRKIPPNIRFTAPNPKIPFDSAKLTVPVEAVDWPQNKLERVSINSFGIGGANAHVILDSAATYGASPPSTSVVGKLGSTDEPPAPLLLLYSAKTTKSLDRMTKGYEEWTKQNPEKAADLAYTLALRREHFSFRSFAMFSNGSIGKPTPPTQAIQDPKVIMVFTGQGAQWPLMGRELLQSNSVFQASIDKLQEYLATLAHLQDGSQSAPYSIRDELLKPARKSRMGTAMLSQPLCTAIQIALVDVLRSMSVLPDAVVGHSSGEIAAAYAAGALTAKEAIAIAHFRGAIAGEQTKAGAMAAVGMGRQATQEYLVPNVTIACDNSPSSVTISGDADAVKAVVATIKKSCPNVLARLLQVDKAYHSHHMAEIGDRYHDLISPRIVTKQPGVPFFSSVTGRRLDEQLHHAGDQLPLGPRYWQTNLESPVLFNQAVSSIMEDNQVPGKNALFLEVGPHGALQGPLRQIVAGFSLSALHVPVMVRNQDCLESLLAAAGKLYSLGATVDLQALVPRGSCLPDLPRYPWDHKGSFWYESRLSKEWRLRKHPYHDLLGARATEATDLEPVWRNLFHVENVPWVRDHKVGQDVVFPFAGYIALAGEAIRQISGIGDGFSIRNIMVSTALVLSEETPTELVTTLRPHRLTNSLNSQWWQFTVASHNGHLWNKHCTGEVAVLPEALDSFDFKDKLDPSPKKTSMFPRRLVASRWYDHMRKAGLDLGHSFQTLRTIETSTGAEHEAIASVEIGQQADQCNYHIHPTVIDATLQLLGAAAVNGHSYKVRNWLPTSIEKLAITKCHLDYSDMRSLVSAQATSNMSLEGSGRCFARDKLVLEASGIRMSLADNLPADDGPDKHAAARCEWDRDLDLMSVEELFVPEPPAHGPEAESGALLDELAQTCIRATSRLLLSRTEIERNSTGPYATWLNQQGVPRTSTVDENIAVDSRIEELETKLLDTALGPAATALRQVCEGMEDLLDGRPLEAVLRDTALVDLYGMLRQPGSRSKFFRLLGHSRPNLRVLELEAGVGTGSVGREVIKDLTLPGGLVLCSKYTFASSIPVDRNGGQETFPQMQYVTLDLSQDLKAQGFEEADYDLVIANKLIHKTKDVRKLLKASRELLAPGGRLLIQGLCPSLRWVKYIFGTEDEEICSPAALQQECLSAAFEQVQCITPDISSPECTANVVMTVMAHKPTCTTRTRRAVTLLCNDDNDRNGSGHVAKVSASFEKAGYEVNLCTMDECPKAGDDVVSLLDLDGPFLDLMTAARFEQLRSFLLNLRGSSGILWLTGSTEAGSEVSDPRYGLTVGFGRTMRTEMLIDFATCGIGGSLDGSVDQAVQVFAKFTSRDRDGAVGLQDDMEYIIDGNGHVLVGRLFPFALREELVMSEATDRAVLDVGTPGRINTLQWWSQPRERIQSGEVEVEVYSAGLNFRDVLVAMGIVELPVRQLGMEAAGIVTAVGPGVEGFCIGDRVVCLKKHAFATTFTTPEFCCAKIPDRLTFDEAACMLVPYVTAIHSLANIGRLSQGQTVLIHSAGGGVGLAALGVAQMLGAQIYVTVGSEEKVQHMMTTFGIPRHRIFNSRDASFVQEILRETSGQGVDVILNSLSGQLLHETWRCVAEFGTMVEIGKRDLIGDGKLDMRPFLANRTYSCVDIDQLWRKPQVLKGLISSTLEYYEAGQIAPVRPTKMFTAAETQDAFRFMQKGMHIGRIGLVVRTPEAGEVQIRPEETAKRALRLAFDRSGPASYLLVGGLGGLGKALCRWMADQHARELVVLSRGAGADPAHQALADELATLGCGLKLVRGDVTRMDDVKAAVEAASHPLKGVVQMSMVLRDQSFEKMTFTEWTEAVAPKVQGTWNLHQATKGFDLRFFVLFSSLSGVVGQPGQTNYVSANTFLDAMARYRASIGLAASVVDIGAVEDIGVISRSDGLMDKMKTSGFKKISERELLDAMALAMSQPPPPLVVPQAFVLGLGSDSSLGSADNRAVWRRDRRMAVYHNFSGAGADAVQEASSTDEALRAFLRNTKADPSILKTDDAVQVLAAAIGGKLLALLLRPQEDLDVTASLHTVGLDSLVAIELRAWWKQVFSFDISVLEMLGMGSLEALGKHAAKSLLEKA